MIAHVITIVMCTFFRLCVNSQHAWAGQASAEESITDIMSQKVHITIVMSWAVMTKPGWGRANSHTNFGNSHANCVGVPNANNNSNEFPNKFAFWNSKREGMAVTLQSQWGFRSYLKYPTGNSNMNWNKPKDPGVISVDRSTKATLSTYNTWVERSRLQSV